MLNKNNKHYNFYKAGFNAGVEAGIKAYDKEYMPKVQLETAQRVMVEIYAQMCLALHDTYGFGEKRIQKMVEEMLRSDEYVRTNNLTYADMESIVLEECNVNIRKMIAEQDAIIAKEVEEKNWRGRNA